MVPTRRAPEVRAVLRRLALQHNRWIDALCRHVGISRSDYDALEALDEHGSLTPSELARLLNLTSGAVTALIDRLEKLGWASRNRHLDDRRKVIVTLTQNAWQIGQDDLKPYHQAIDTAVRHHNKDERALIVGFLEALANKVARIPTPHQRSTAK